MEDLDIRFVSSSAPSPAKKACDFCRARKKRCLPIERADVEADLAESRGHAPARAFQCQTCFKIGTQCTFQTPVKTRGPRKKYRSSLDIARPNSQPLSPGPSGTQSSILSSHSPQSHVSAAISFGSPIPMQSPTQVAGDLVSFDYLSPATSYEGTAFPTDALCSRKLLVVIINDYLTWIYPLVPIVHRPTLQSNLRQSRDLHDTDFLCLLYCLCAATVGFLPRAFNKYQALAGLKAPFTSKVDMINQCYTLCMNQRGPYYFDTVSFQKWAIAYLMQITHLQIGNHNLSRMMEVEAMQIARLLGLHRISEYEGLNCIETQLRKKGFWLMFYVYVHTQFQHLRGERLNYLEQEILKSLTAEELMPIEIDDEYILEDEILQSPSGHECVTTGFNINSRVFWAALMSPSTSKDEDGWIRKQNDSPAHLKDLQGRLQRLKYMLDDIPSTFRQYATPSGTRSSEENRLLESQVTTLRSNIHVTHLWLQSVILDQIGAILQNTPDTTPIGVDENDLWRDREDICRQLLHVLHSIPTVNHEPNGCYLTHKVRDCAAALLACPFPPEEESGRRATRYLTDFTNILANLDNEFMSTVSLQSWVDTDRQHMHV